MPPNPRPYIQNLLGDLRQLFLSNKSDQKVLTALRDELRHRSRPGAIALLAEVERRLNELSERVGADGPDARPGGSASDQPIVGTEPKVVARPNNRAKRSHAAAGARCEEFLRPPPRTKRIEPMGVTARPSKYVRTPKTDVVLDIPPNAPRTVRYAVALAALIADMRKQRQNARQYALEDGERIPLDRGHVGYTFPFTEDAELFEDARIELRVGARRIEGQIVSVSDGRLIIAIEEDLGEQIARCTLIIDNTPLFETLKERLEKSGREGRALNIEIADEVVSNSGAVAPALPHLASPEFAKLNQRQREAVCLALANDVIYLWGPPGTGKTRTLSVLVEELFQRGKRVLICSNTNRAVDQVLFCLCETLTVEHEAMEHGRIVRLGRVTYEPLRDQYAEYVTLDGIVERKSRELGCFLRSI